MGEMLQPVFRTLSVAALLLCWLTPSAKADGVYWSRFSDRIGRANLDGTDVNPNFIRLQSFDNDVRNMAAGDTGIYWLSGSINHKIGRADLDGTDVNLTLISGLEPYQYDWLTVDKTYIYWTRAPGTISRANLDGTEVTKEFISGIFGPVRGLAVDQEHIYWGGGIFGRIGRANLDGTEVNGTFISGLAGDIGGVAVDTTHIYWTNNTGHAISRANLDGTDVDDGFIVLGRPDALAVDGAHVYWVDLVSDSIGRANLDGTGVDQNFIPNVRPRSVAVASQVLPVNRRPIAAAGPDQVVECTSPSGATVVFDGTGSFDPDGDPIVDFVWTGSFGTANGAMPTVAIPFGSETVNLVVYDDQNAASEPGTLQVTVQDTVAPDMSLAASPAVLWPPNGKMVPVRIKAEAKDTCDPTPVCRITAVSSSEGRMGRSDWQLESDLSLKLRARRKGKGSGRTYTIVVECVDGSGNRSMGTTGVLVPHDRARTVR